MEASADIIFALRGSSEWFAQLELERLFFSKWSFYGTDKNCRKLCKGEKTGGYKGGETDAGLYVLADFKGGLEIRVSGQGELKMVQ